MLSEGFQADSNNYMVVVSILVFLIRLSSHTNNHKLRAETPGK